ncbi:LysR family transcriptional regulator [Paludibacterium yongneupense]|uniref:LysR family transcriptional regulator n=1 Tax=Paludibacterium yongneupense TaxID=400061 RepID=UPI00041CDFB1|nr:LysR family transcriptional regulator [Paludibacterium yongneupense]
MLASLDALLEQGNVTKAAQRLHISQPALSAQLGRLRTLFDDALLVPAKQGRGMVLTHRAEAIKAPLHQALERLKQLLEAPPDFVPEQAQRTFVLIMNDNAASMLAGPLLALAQQAKARGVRLAFLNLPKSRVGEALERGEADIAIGTPPDSGEWLISRRLLRDEFCVACRRGLVSGAVDLNTYLSLPHAMVSGDGGNFASAVDTALAKLGLRRDVAISVQNYGVIPTILMSSDCLCTLPKRFLASFGMHLELHPMPFSLPEFALSAFWHTRSSHDPGHMWLREQLFSIA